MSAGTRTATRMAFRDQWRRPLVLINRDIEGITRVLIDTAPCETVIVTN